MLINRIVRKLKRISILDTISAVFNKKIILFWSIHYETKFNFGDAINPYLFKCLTGKEVSSANGMINLFNKPVYYFIGSILNNINNPNAIICGSGFISQDGTIKKKPKLVIAVRGPLTRDIFLNHNVQCPEIYCDPALLLPIFIPSKNQSPKCNVGIIAHYTDKKIIKDINIINESLSYKFIDIESDMNVFIQELCDCKVILSSSLHGIIVAHAYKIPATWIKLSNNLTGDSFKFRDYALSVGEQNILPLEVEFKLNLKNAIDKSRLYDISSNQKKLLNAFREIKLINEKFTFE